MIKKILSYKVITIITCLLSLFNLFIYFSMRCIWTGIGKVLNGNQLIPNLLMIIIFVIFAVCLTLAFFRKEKLPMYIMLGISVVLLIGLAVIIYKGAWDYLIFIGREFVDCLCFLAICLLIIWFIFYYPNCKCKRIKFIRYLSISLIILIITFEKLGLGINYFTYKPVVYAVEEEYQIVFSSNLDSTAWVTVGDKEYYDLYAGSSKSETKIHKVVIPMSELNEHKQYEVNIKAMFMRGPYGSFEGNTKSLVTHFRPVDVSDGLDYYTISDVHGAIDSGIKTASFLKDKLDMLLILGDVYSFLDNVSDVQSINKLSYGVTKGEIPVVYARGNHETKGTMADQLYKYVGSKDQKFYYTVNLNDVWLVVLDSGEDHNDDWWEYYDTAHFEQYREEQTKMLEECLVREEYKDAKYKLALCHFPMTYVSSWKFLENIKQKWTDLFNQIGVDMHLAGHEHELIPIIPGDFTPNEKLVYCNSQYTDKNSTNEGYFTDASFYSFIVSSRNDVQNIYKEQNQLGKKMTGLSTSVDFNTNKIIVQYTNQLNQPLEIVNPFNDKSYGTIFNLELK